MVPQRAGAVSLLFLFTASLAGCSGDSGGDSKAAAPSSSDPLGDVPTGRVEGQVVDEEVLPVDQAAVGLSDALSINTLTDSTGRFLLTRVPEGPHELLVQKDGYRNAALQITVVAGETLDVKFLLKAVPKSVPRQANYIFTGYLGFDLAVPSGNQFGPGPAGDTKRTVYYAVEQPDLVGAYSGIQWTGNAPVVSDRAYILIYLALDKSLNCDDAARTYCVPMAWAEGKSPQANGSGDYQEQMRDRKDLRINVRFKMRPCVTADLGTGWVNPTRCPNPADLVKLALDQKVTAYTSLFYGLAPPAGFNPVPA